MPKPKNKTEYPLPWQMSKYEFDYYVLELLHQCPFIAWDKIEKNQNITDGKHLYHVQQYPPAKSYLMVGITGQDGLDPAASFKLKKADHGWKKPQHSGHLRLVPQEIVDFVTRNHLESIKAAIADAQSIPGHVMSSYPDLFMKKPLQVNEQEFTRIKEAITGCRVDVEYRPPRIRVIHIRRDIRRLENELAFEQDMITYIQEGGGNYKKPQESINFHKQTIESRQREIYLLSLAIEYLNSQCIHNPNLKEMPRA